ncbi:hypothetical protein O7626_30210 [Micromonospora sp. WMMD1102]|uniref:hypothetical protein n=1 Tax=Micromonospora sp. WMMD1102 TaxID=3016105 RepID=UPI00241571AD|nr:hypothetical protein [Micromonospora sp. WMMD1102]MDG4790145.1 hypothetical protein [Micromonospora sp. WMMD1102]
MSNIVDDEGGSPASRGQAILQEVTRRPRRRLPVTILALVVAIAIGSVLATAIVYWPTDRRESAPVAAPSGKQQSPDGVGFSVTPATSHGVYESVGRPCVAVGWAPIAAEVGGKPGSDPQESSTVLGSMATLRCSVALGEGETHGVAMAEITIFGNSSAEGTYEGLRRTIPGDIVLTPISGLGTAAYAYVEKDAGPAVVAYDGNMHIRLVWVPLQRQMLPMYGGLARALAEVARQTMDYLRV